jgi:hypothetical protein
VSGHPPLFSSLERHLRRSGKKGGWSGGLEQIWPFQKSEYLKIWTPGMIKVATHLNNPSQNYQSKTIMKGNYYFETQTRICTYSFAILAIFYTICPYMLRQRSHRAVFMCCDSCVRESLDFSQTFFLQVRIEFGLLLVRYLWPVVWPQYPSPETRPRLQNPLGLSWELKSSSTGPQVAEITNTN